MATGVGRHSDLEEEVKSPDAEAAAGLIFGSYGKRHVSALRWVFFVGRLGERTVRACRVVPGVLRHVFVHGC